MVEGCGVGWGVGSGDVARYVQCSFLAAHPNNICASFPRLISRNLKTWTLKEKCSEAERKYNEINDNYLSMIYNKKIQFKGGGWKHDDMIRIKSNKKTEI